MVKRKETDGDLGLEWCVYLDEDQKEKEAEPAVFQFHQIPLHGKSNKRAKARNSPQVMHWPILP